MIYNEIMNQELLKETIGELIGLVNGTYDKEINIQEELYKIMDLLIDDKIKEANDFIIECKYHYLGRCMSCNSPCGNSGCIQLEDKQLIKYETLKESYHQNMDYHKLCRKIVDIAY